MPIEKKNISISFAGGLDTKTDPSQVIPGKFETLENCIFDEGMVFKKRFGYQRLSATTAQSLTTYNNELVLFDNQNLYSFNPQAPTQNYSNTFSAKYPDFVNKGAITSVDIRTSQVATSPYSLLRPKIAYSPANNYALYTWYVDAGSTYWQYAVFNTVTGAQVIAPTLISDESGYAINTVQPFCLGNYFIIVYEVSSYFLRAIVLNATTLASVSLLTITSTLNSTQITPCILGDRLYISWATGNVPAGSYNYGVATMWIDSSLNISQTVTQPLIWIGTSHAPVQVVNIPDPVTNTVWVFFSIYDTYGPYYALAGVVLNADLSLNQAQTSYITFGSATHVKNITGFAASSSSTQVPAMNVYYEIDNAFTLSDGHAYTTNGINSFLAQGGSAYSELTFLRGVGIFSQPFAYNGTYYMAVAYGQIEGGSGSLVGSYLQQTYFIVSITGAIVAKIAYGNGGGYTADGACNLPNIGGNSYLMPYLFADEDSAYASNLILNSGVKSAVLDFSGGGNFQTLTLGKALQIGGAGFLWQYDGNQVCENNFHLYPDDVYVSDPTSASSTALSAGTYQYTAIYQWMDAAGQIHRSAPTPPITVTVPAPGTSAVSIFIPYLRLTNKTPPSSISLLYYRTAPSISATTFYRVNGLTANLNSTTADGVSINDAYDDTSISQNDILYTSGGVLEDTGGPPTAAITNYRNRVWAINAEDRNQFWYSKTTLEATPVEMTGSQTFYVDPRFGEVTAAAVMDDKIIFFKESDSQCAIFYTVGQGPDATGNNNDLSDAIFITSIVGCQIPQSIVMTQMGLMFKSNKGIWLLSRDLSISYVGAAVEKYNAQNVTSALVIPSTTQIRFTSDEGDSIVQDYFYQIWGTHTYKAQSATIWNGQFTFLDAQGYLCQETPGVYTDNGRFIARKVTTSWLSLAGLQGFQRAVKIYMLARYLNPSNLLVSVAYDFNPAVVQTGKFTPSFLYNSNWGSNSFWGAGSRWGGSSGPLQFEMRLDRQKCQSIQITITESLDPSNPDYGAGSEWEALGLVVGVKATTPRLPAGQKIS